MGSDGFIGHGGKLTRREEIGKRAGELENPRSRSPPRVAVVAEEPVAGGRVVFFRALVLWVIGSGLDHSIRLIDFPVEVM